MRIIAGIARGRHLYTPRGLQTRPTLDKVRGALFNILAEVVPGSKVLDLFAGTGALGIEALSRGAWYCLFLEKERLALEAIKRNLRTAGLEPRARVLKIDVFKSLAYLESCQTGFELVLAGPPYRVLEEEKDRERLFRLFEELAGHGILHPPGIVVLEHRGKSGEMPLRLGTLCLFDQKTYGDTVLSLWHMLK